MNSLWEGVRAAFHRPETRTYRWVQGFVWALIALSVLLIALELVAAPGPPWGTILDQLDRFVLWFFGAELVLRVLSYRPASLDFFHLSPAGKLRVHLLGRLRYCLTPLMLVDILTVAALVPALRGLRVLRLLRLLRTIKVFRYSNPFLGLERAFRENGLLFSFALSILGTSMLLGGISIFLIEGRVNEDINSVGDGIWWAVVTLTTVGFGDITPTTALGKVVGGVLMLAGMFNLALFAGIVGRTLLTSVLGIQEEQFRMSGYIDHIVICGYDEGAQMLLDALASEFDPHTTGIVLFGPQDRPEQVPPEFLWVKGDPTKQSELDKARLSHARAVVLVAPRTVATQHADATTILTTFTIRSHLRARSEDDSRARNLYIVAEILEEENVEHARAAGADEVIESNRLGFSLLAHAIAVPGTAAIISRVANTGANNVYLADPPPDLDLPAPFEQVAHYLKQRGALLMGLRDPVSKEDRMNPRDSELVPPGVRLIYLAEWPVLGED